MIKNFLSTQIFIHKNVMALEERFQAILLDAYGVFWGGDRAGLLPGSKETLEKLVLSHKIVGILSNASRFSFKEIEKFKAHGLLQGVHFHFMVTSGDVAKKIFSHEKLPFETPKKKYWLFGGPHPRFHHHQAIFQDTVYSETPDLRDADFIFISIPHINGEDETNPELFRKEVQKVVETGLPMVCVNPDHFAHEGDPPRLVVRQGSIAAMYEQLGGKVFYVGKPSLGAFREAMDQFYERNITQPENVLMVGDTPETDIRGARHFGMASALVTQTGIIKDRIAENGFHILQNLPSYDQPHYFIERL